MSKTTTTCPVSWRGFFQIALAVAAFFMVDPYIRKLLSFVQEHCIAELSPHWFGAFVCLLVVCCFCLLFGRYGNTYIPIQLRCGLLLVAAAYLYYRLSPCCYYRLSPEFYFWRIPLGDWAVFRATWTDLLLLPIAGCLLTRKIRTYLHLQLTGICLLLIRKGKEVSDLTEEDNPEQIRVQAIQNDIAIEKEADDWLGFSAMVKVLFEGLCLLDLRRESLTMGIIAEWGKGKSSFINLLINNVENHGDIIIRFNPRGSKSAANIQEDFFDAFASELSKYYAGFGFLLGRYTKHLGLLGQYEWTRPLESVLTLLLPEKDVETINKAISTLGKRVYVVIDDLDRLTGEEILEVLKLVDRNASFNNVVFVMAYDKEYINNVLRKHLDHGLDHSFIDKYVTWEVTLPESDKERLKLLMELLLSRKVKANTSAEYGQLLWGWHRVSSIVVDSLGSVRDLKRYLNLMLPHYNEVVDKVDCEDFLLLQLLRYKDLGVYVGLQSRRLLQLDTSKRNYVLTPSFEEDLKSISKWGGTKSILEKLFPKESVDGVASESCISLRSKECIDNYFVGLQRDQSTPYFRDILNIVKCQEIGGASSFIDFMIQEQGIEYMTNILLYLVKSPCFSDEDRAQTIDLMAYVGSKIYQTEGGQNVLIKELTELFSKDRYERYKEFGVIESLSQYQRLLRPMLSRMICEQPYLMSTVIDRVASRDSKPFLRCVYSRKNISDILLGCQKSYYHQWTPRGHSYECVRSFICKSYMNNFQYVKLSVGGLVSLIHRYPEECVWIILSKETSFILPPDSFELRLYSSLLDLLEQEGFSLKAWRALKEDSKLIDILKYAKDKRDESLSVDGPLCNWYSESVEMFSWRIELLPQEKVDLDNIDYVYRAVLAQEERDRQQATSEVG